MIKGTELFVKALKEEGVDTLFGYPGGQAIDLFDALYDQDDIEVILPRHEQALIHAADGICKVNRKDRCVPCHKRSGCNKPCNRIATAIMTAFRLYALQVRFR